MKTKIIESGKYLKLIVNETTIWYCRIRKRKKNETSLYDNKHNIIIELIIKDKNNYRFDETCIDVIEKLGFENITFEEWSNALKEFKVYVNKLK